MILLDTHVWFWWVQGSPALRPSMAETIAAEERDGLAVCAISLLEVARATALGGMELPLPSERWLDTALAYPGIRLLPLTPAIVVEAYRLPEPFHKDPADRLVVATARVHDLTLLTEDAKILAYPHVRVYRSTS